MASTPTELVAAEARAQCQSNDAPEATALAGTDASSVVAVTHASVQTRDTGSEAIGAGARQESCRTRAHAQRVQSTESEARATSAPSTAVHTEVFALGARVLDAGGRLPKNRAMTPRRITPLLAVALASSGLAQPGRAQDPSRVPDPSRSQTAMASEQPTPAEVRSQRILALEAEVRAAHERLASLVSEVPAEGDPPLRERPELLEIASELATLNAELRELRAEVARESPAPSSP